jgi:hypothetical protein
MTLEIFNDNADSVGIYRVALPVGWYKPVDADNPDLEETLQEVLRTMEIHNGSVVETVNWNVVFDEVNFNFTISSNVGNTSGGAYYFRILPNSVYINVDYYTKLTTDPLPVPFGRVEDDLTTMMGFTAPIVPSGDDLFLVVKGGFASCQYTPYVDIVSNILTKNQSVQDNDSALRNGRAKLARLYLSNDRMEALTPDNIIGVRPFKFRREFATPKVISWNTTENVDVIDLQVLDYKGYPLYISPLIDELAGSPDFLFIGNTANFQFTIQASEV